jgi:hypothetical protein
MSRHILFIAAVVGSLSLGLALTAVAQQGGQAESKNEAKKAPPVRPGLFFSEGWKQQTKFSFQAPMTQEFVSNPNLELKIYGGAPDKGATILFTQHDAAEPGHGWNGMCNPTCALTLHDRGNYADLTGLARVSYQSFVNGFHQIRPIIKVADGTWLVGDKAIGTSSEYHVTEFLVQDIRWKKLDIAHVLEANDGKWVAADLSHVDEIGWTDLTAGNGHGQGGWAGVGKIEVYGKAVARTSMTSQRGLGQ